MVLELMKQRIPEMFAGIIQDRFETWFLCLLSSKSQKVLNPRWALVQNIILYKSPWGGGGDLWLLTVCFYRAQCCRQSGNLPAFQSGVQAWMTLVRDGRGAGGALAETPVPALHLTPWGIKLRSCWYSQSCRTVRDSNDKRLIRSLISFVFYVRHAVCDATPNLRNCSFNPAAQLFFFFFFLMILCDWKRVVSAFPGGSMVQDKVWKPRPCAQWSCAPTAPCTCRDGCSGLCFSWSLRLRWGQTVPEHASATFRVKCIASSGTWPQFLIPSSHTWKGSTSGEFQLPLCRIESTLEQKLIWIDWPIKTTGWINSANFTKSKRDFDYTAPTAVRQ